MSIDQRRDLIRRLSLASEDGMAARRRSVGPREVQIVVTVVSAVILVPWIVYLAVALPRVYVTHNWDEAWVGFDLLLLLLLVATAIFGYLTAPDGHADRVCHRCAADLRRWFDWMTSNRSDVGWATVTALFVELPLAALLITEACRLMRVVPVRWGVLDGSVHAWEVQIPLPSGPEHSVWGRRARGQ